MMNIPCLIVDDEPLARGVLEKYVADCPMLTLVGSCSNAFEAITAINEKEIELMFLDINMPKLSGISLAKTMADPPEIIFTTAYPEFAVEGFELDAADYLVKPISFERFLKAVDKVIGRYQVRSQLSNLSGKGTSKQSMIVRADGKIYQLELKNIFFLEACGDYVRFFLDEKKITTHGTLKSFEKLLPSDQFLRIHRSYIIAIDRINYIDGNRVNIADKFLPVGSSYKEKLLSLLEDRNKP